MPSTVDAPAEIEEVAVQDLGVAPARLIDVEPVRDVNGREAIGAIAERHRPQADGVHQAEDGDVGADADGHRQQRADEESRLLRQAAPGVRRSRKGRVTRLPSAIVGSTRAARRAGTHVASSNATVSGSAIDANSHGIDADTVQAAGEGARDADGERSARRPGRRRRREPFAAPASR